MPESQHPKLVSATYSTENAIEISSTSETLICCLFPKNIYKKKHRQKITVIQTKHIASKQRSQKLFDGINKLKFFLSSQSLMVYDFHRHCLVLKNDFPRKKIYKRKF